MKKEKRENNRGKINKTQTQKHKRNKMKEKERGYYKTGGSNQQED